MIAHGHFFGCPCTEFVDYHGVRYCTVCGLRDTSKRSVDLVESGIERVPAAGRPRDVTGSPKEAPDD